MDNKVFIKEMCQKGLEIKGVANDEWYQNQLDHELDVIFECGLEDFFLNTAYILAYLDDKGIIRSAGRGSACASVVCYALNITKLPVKGMGLSFARFLNKTRVLTSLPDIDIDFASSQRQEALLHIRDIYGEDRTGQVINKVNFTPKMLIKDLASRKGLDFKEVNKVTSFLSGKEDDYHKNERVMEYLNRHPEIKNYIDPLIGVTKNYNVHAGAMIILDKEIDNYCSFVKVKGKDVISDNGRECEAMGFLKNDCLALKSLDIQKDAINLVNDDIVLPHIFDDPKVYEAININTTGIFQLEGAAGIDGVNKVHPDNFEELMDVIALIRPGARNSGYLELYADYKFGRKEVTYLDPKLEEILGDTFGLMIYQENIMRVANELAGFSDLETDNLRRAVAKKKPEAFEVFKPKFIQGCVDNDVKKEVAEKLWSDIENASEYSFNKAHCYSYAAVSYQSAWLKAYYPLEFAVAMLQNISNSEDEKRIKVLNMIKDSNAELCSPDINLSQGDTTIAGDKIYIGLNIISNVSSNVSGAILREREENGDFKSFEDFIQRIPPRVCNKRSKEALVWAGAFDNIPVV